MGEAEGPQVTEQIDITTLPADQVPAWLIKDPVDPKAPKPVTTEAAPAPASPPEAPQPVNFSTDEGVPDWLRETIPDTAAPQTSISSGTPKPEPAPNLPPFVPAPRDEDPIEEATRHKRRQEQHLQQLITDSKANKEKNAMKIADANLQFWKLDHEFMEYIKDLNVGEVSDLVLSGILQDYQQSDEYAKRFAGPGPQKPAETEQAEKPVTLVGMARPPKLQRAGDLKDRVGKTLLNLGKPVPKVDPLNRSVS